MSSLKKNIISNYIGRAWPALLSIILVPTYISFLGIESYGLIGFYTSLSAVIGIFDLGIGSTMNRELAKRSTIVSQQDTQRDLVKTLEIIYWIIAIIVGIIIIFLSSFIANTWIKAENLPPQLISSAVMFMGLSIALRFPLSLYQGGLMGLQKQVLVNKLLIILGTVRGLGAVAVLWLISSKIDIFFIWQSIISLVGSIVFLFALWSNLPKTNIKSVFRISILFEIWSYAAAISLNAIIGMIMSQLDKILLSTLLSLKLFAYYSIASTVASALWMIINPFNNAVFPKLVELISKDNYQRLKNFFHEMSQILSLLLLPIGFILIFYSKEILLVWLNDPVIAENTYLIMSFLVLGTLLNGLNSMPIYSANAYGWPMLMTYSNLFQSIFIIPLIIFMVNEFSAIGASIAWVIMNSTYLIITIPIFFRRFLKDEVKKWYYKDVLIPLFFSLLTCCISKLIAPDLNSLILKLMWISLTLFVSLVMTGLSMSVTRKYIFSNFSK